MPPFIRDGLACGDGHRHAAGPPDHHPAIRVFLLRQHRAALAHRWLIRAVGARLAKRRSPRHLAVTAFQPLSPDAPFTERR